MLRWLGLWMGILGLLTGNIYAQSEDSGWICPGDFSGETLHVYNWTTYIAPETVGIFEDKCDVEVIYSEYESDSTMLVELRRGNTPYDIVVPGLETVGTMIEERLLQRLDHSLLPNLDNIFAAFRNLPQDPEHLYSVPYQWGTIGVGYNQNNVDADIRTWDDVFNYDGRIGWMDEPQIMMGIALRYLGYSTSTHDMRELAEARDLLIDFGRDNAQIIQDSVGQDLLYEGDLDMVIEYSGDILQLNADCDCDDYVYVIPEDGANLWFDMMAIPIDSPRRELAHAFIDFILDVHISAGISNAVAYASPNQKALERQLIREELVTNRAIYPSLDMLDNMFMLDTLEPNIQRIYRNYWDEIRILFEVGDDYENE
jgi:spermidine/putrescine transport system substrate-binding protein